MAKRPRAETEAAREKSSELIARIAEQQMFRTIENTQERQLWQDNQSENKKKKSSRS